MVNLVKENVQVLTPSHSCIVKEVVSLEGGAELNLDMLGGHPTGVLRAGCPVALCEDGTWEVCAGANGNTYTSEFEQGDATRGFGVLAHDVAIVDGAAYGAIMVMGVVDCAKSPVAFSDEYIFRSTNGIVFLNVPVPTE